MLNRRPELFNLPVFRYARETMPVLAVIVPDQKAGLSSYGVASLTCWATQKPLGERDAKWITRREPNSMMKKTKTLRMNRS